MRHRFFCLDDHTRNPVRDASDNLVVDGTKLCGQLVGRYFRSALPADNNSFVTELDLAAER